MIVVDRYTTVIQIANQGIPALERIVDYPSNRGAIRGLAALQSEPSVVFLHDGFSLGLAYSPSFIRLERSGL
jgi:hypothetical protein